MVVLVESDDAGSAGSRVIDAISGVPYLASLSPVIINGDNTAAMINVISEGGPNDQRTADLVKEIRTAVSGIPDASVAVTGETAVSIDVDAKLHTALIMYIALIVGLAFVLLTVLFRSFFVPLVATVGFLLSLGAGMGASVAVFQWGWLGSLFGGSEGAPILSFLPVIVVGILFGLAMDYQVFLVSRIHEAHVRGLSTKEAIVDGFARSGPVVVAAATIMAAVFGGFMLSGDSLVGSIALALTVGVITDAFVVRMIIVPAAMSLMGRHSWWLPAKLDRILPHIDAEGHDLDVDPKDERAPRRAMQT
jgi:RND superfamily putative drug exporter